MARRDDDDEIVYVRDGGGSGIKWFPAGATVGGMLALFAPQSGEQTHRPSAQDARPPYAAEDGLTIWATVEEGKSGAGGGGAGQGRRPRRVTKWGRRRRPGGGAGRWRRSARAERRLADARTRRRAPHGRRRAAI
jgi:hypothetical protein